jgi:hypothetical protein
MHEFLSNNSIDVLNVPLYFGFFFGFWALEVIDI